MRSLVRIQPGPPKKPLEDKGFLVSRAGAGYPGGAQPDANQAARPAMMSSRALGGSLIQALVEVAVGVQRRLDGDMPEPRLNQLWVLSRGDEHGRVGVPRVGESARLAHRGAHRRGPVPVPELG